MATDLIEELVTRAKAHARAASRVRANETRDIVRELIAALETQAEHLQYFRDSPNLAFYNQGLKDRECIQRVEKYIELQLAREKPLHPQTLLRLLDGSATSEDPVPQPH